MSGWAPMDNRPAKLFIRRDCQGRAVISKAAAIHLGNHVRVLLDGDRFRVQTCGAAEPGARKIRVMERFYFVCTAFSRRLPARGRIPVSLGPNYIEGQFPEVHDDSVQ